MVYRVGRPATAAAASLLVLMTQPALAQTAPAPEAPLDPAAPLAELPGIGVDWPDLSAEPATPADAQTDAAAERRYAWRLEGVDGIAGDVLRQRFDQFSALNANDGDEANAAQLDRRAREDAELLTTLLRAEGYYDARVATRIEPPTPANARPLVVLEATPGALYRFNGVTLAGVEAAGDKAATLRGAFGIGVDDPVNADAVANGEAALRAAIGREGFPFARVGEPEIVVDRAARTATLALSVAPGGARRFGRITTNPDNGVFGADHVADIARFRPGQPYDDTALLDLRRALIQTSLVSSVEVTPVPGATADTVDIAVKLEPAPPRTIAGELGYGTGEGARAELSWTHRNLFPPEGALTVRGVLGTREQLGSLVLRRANFRGRDRVLTAQIAAAHLERDAFKADTLSIGASLERQTNIFFQKTWTWSLGAELLASDERDVVVSTGAGRRRTFLIGALPTSLTYDGSDDLLNPQRGFRLGGRLSPELSLQGSAFGYTRAQIDASVYQPFGSTVLAARTRVGSILGAPRDQVAPSRRYYAGGGASVRGYGYQDIGPRDVNGDPIGGRSLVEFSIEARVKTFGAFGVVPFLDAGNIATGVLPKLSGLRYGAGVGVRYYSSFGPIRVDIGTPINPQPGVARVAVYVSLGQAF
ncbi:autotransporter assembly complex protein TamA [Sphingomonas sp.]|uniref:autotransporter assembly complex protein TamA n=1 Tax=Sphingomonas sp. TaxID=28214 RepID=UPI0039C95367